MPESTWNEWELIEGFSFQNEKSLAQWSSNAKRLGVTAWELAILDSIWYGYGQVKSTELLVERAFGCFYEKNPKKADAALDRVFNEGWIQFLNTDFLLEIHTELKEGGYLIPKDLIRYAKEIADTPESNLGIISFTRDGIVLFKDWYYSVFQINEPYTSHWVLKRHDDDWWSVFGITLNDCLCGMVAGQDEGRQILEMEAPIKIGRWCDRWWRRFENGYQIRFKLRVSSSECCQ